MTHLRISPEEYPWEAECLNAKCFTETHTRHKDARRKPTCSVAWRQPLIPCDSGRPGSVLPHRSHSPCTQPRVVSCHRYTTCSPPLHSAHKPSIHILLSIPHHRHTTCILPCSVSTQTIYFVVHVMPPTYNMHSSPLRSTHKPFILLSLSHHRHTASSLPLCSAHKPSVHTLLFISHHKPA